MSNDYIILGLSVSIGLLAWLFQQRDAARQSEIKLLFEKHDQDAKRLEDLQLEIARQYYVKPEIDSRLDRITIGIDRLSAEIKELTEAVLRRRS